MTEKIRSIKQKIQTSLNEIHDVSLKKKARELFTKVNSSYDVKLPDNPTPADINAEHSRLKKVSNEISSDIRDLTKNIAESSKGVEAKMLITYLTVFNQMMCQTIINDLVAASKNVKGMGVQSKEYHSDMMNRTKENTKLGFFGMSDAEIPAKRKTVMKALDDSAMSIKRFRENVKKRFSNIKEIDINDVDNAIKELNKLHENALHCLKDAESMQRAGSLFDDVGDTKQAARDIVECKIIINGFYHGAKSELDRISEKVSKSLSKKIDGRSYN